MFDITVIIPTYNRKELLDRALKSVYQQESFVTDIIVVDDASTDGTDRFMKDYHSRCKYYRLEENRGVCCARNFGLLQCRTPYAILLDSDDEFQPGIIALVKQELEAFITVNGQYPVYLFLRNTGRIREEGISVLRGEHVVRGCVAGNTTEVVDVERFLKRGYCYPEEISRVGGEHLLWLEIAKNDGIPIFNRYITVENEDADNRLTSPHTQLRKAYDHALLQEKVITGYEDLYMQYNKKEFLKRIHACSIYWKLAGNMNKALYWAGRGIMVCWNFQSVLAGIFALLPGFLARKVFIRWRNL